MAAQFEVYKCDICGNIVEMLFAKKDTLACCGKPMKKLTENSTDAAQEKHVPVVSAHDGGTKVVVGSVAHPMTDEHYIQWIEVATADGRHIKKFLKPGDAPEFQACFAKDDVVSVREYCNLHGLWKA